MKKRLMPEYVRAFSWLCWIVYFFTYFGRYSFISSMGALVADETMTKTDAGLASALFYMAYSVAQFLCGLAGDKLSPRRLVFIGVFGSAVCNLLFPVCPNTLSMLVLWSINGVLQGFVWPPLIRMCSMLLDGNQCVQVSVDLASSSPVSMVVIYLLGAWSLGTLGWTFLFYLSGAVMAVIALAWAFGMRKLETSCCNEVKDDSPAPEQEAEGASAPLWTTVLETGLIFAALASVSNGALKDGVFTWVPTYLMENFNVTAGYATLLTTVLPILNLLGVYLAKHMNRKWLRNEATTSAALYAGAFLTLLAMQWEGNIVWTVALFAVSTTLMTGVNTVLVTLFPLHYHRYGRVAGVTGILNTCVHIGGAVSGYLFGYLSDVAGWSALRMVWCVLALVGAVFCIMHKSRWGKCRSPEIL